MLKLVAIAEDEGETYEVPLLDENDWPTKMMIITGLIELAIDIYLGYAAYRFFKNRAARKAK